MRTAIATHELLPEGLYLESLSIETGRVSIRVASETGRSYGCCHQPQCKLHCMRSISEWQTFAHVELEPAVGVDVPVEQRCQAPHVLLREALGPRGV